MKIKVWLVDIPCLQNRTNIRFPAAADRLEVYEDIMGFFWSCANAFPVLTLVPAFLYPLVVLLDSVKDDIKLIDKQTHRAHVGRLGYCQTKGL